MMFVIVEEDVKQLIHLAEGRYFAFREKERIKRNIFKEDILKTDFNNKQLGFLIGDLFRLKEVLYEMHGGKLVEY